MLLCVVKKFFIAVVVLLFTVNTIQGAENTSAKEQDEQLLKMEQEYLRLQEFEESLKKDPAAYEAYQKQRQEAHQARINAYEKAVEAMGNNLRMIQAINPIEGKYYSTEGLYTFPFTVIAPYPEIAHVNTVLNYKFPKRLGNTMAQFVQVYNPESGYSIRYYAPNTYIDIFIYDVPSSVKKEDALIIDQLLQVSKTMWRTYKSVKIEDVLLYSFKGDDKLRGLGFFAQFESANFDFSGEMKTYQSWAMVFIKKQKFIKFRITQICSNQKKFAEFINFFMHEFDKNVILDSVTRTQKFTDKIVPPIIMEF